MSNAQKHIENPAFLRHRRTDLLRKSNPPLYRTGADCLFVIRDSEIVQILLKPVLRRKAGITQVAALVLPLLQAPVVEHLDVVLDDKRHDVVPQAFFEKEQAPDSAVAVLERMDALKAVVKVKQIVKGFALNGVVFSKQFLHLSTDILRCSCVHIMTFDSKGELLITIMSSLAQEESRSISENVTWGQRKRFSDGKVSIPYGQFLGYRKGADGLPEIVPEEAEVVRRIYRELLQGKSTNAIAAMLTEEGIPTPGKKTVWQRATVESILRNEKYKGSALLQKSFTVDFLTKKTKINEGEVPQYYVEDSHPAIIEPREWEKVQSELERRKNSRTRHRQTSPFSGKIFCADCGEIFGAKTWHSTDRYRRIVWQCNGKFKGERKCETPHLTEERLKELFLAALGAYLSDRNAAIDQLRYAQRALTDTDFIDADIQTLEEELTGITGMLRLCIEENAANTTTEEAYRTAHADLCRRFEETEAKLAALQQRREKMKADAIAIGGLMFELGELTALPLTFDEKLWNGTVDHVTVHADERVVFRFKDGKEITTRL